MDLSLPIANMYSVFGCSIFTLNGFPRQFLCHRTGRSNQSIREKKVLVVAKGVKYLLHTIARADVVCAVLFTCLPFYLSNH